MEGLGWSAGNGIASSWIRSYCNAADLALHSREQDWSLGECGWGLMPVTPRISSKAGKSKASHSGRYLLAPWVLFVLPPSLLPIKMYGSNLASRAMFLTVAYVSLLTKVCQTLIQPFILQVNVSLPAAKTFLLNSKSVCLFLEISRLEI